MTKSLRKSLIYLIMTMLVVPTWLVTGMMNAQHAKAEAPVNVTTVAATSVTSTNATLNGLNGSTAATGHSFWVSTDPIDTSSSSIPAGVYSTLDFGPIAADTPFSAFLSSATGLPAVTANTKYYFAAWSLVGGTWYPGEILNFTTTLPGTISAEDFGVVNYDVGGGLGTLKGYTAGFGLTYATFDVAQSIVVRLYADNQLLQTNTATLKVGSLVGAQAISSPFDVSGSFHYVTDGYWVNVRATEYGQSIPATKVVAIVTLANGKVVTAENTILTGDPTTIMLPGTISAEDFGVVNYDVGGGLGTLKGYTAGFGLTDADFTGASSIVMQLFAAGDQLLQTNTLNGPNAGLVTGAQISSPFDVSGTFDYVTDGYWTNVRETEYGQSIPATKVVATVTLANGKVVTATNTNLTGDDPTTIYPPAIIIPASPDFTVTALSGKSFRVDWTGNGADLYYININGNSDPNGPIPFSSTEKYSRVITVSEYGVYNITLIAEKGGVLSTNFKTHSVDIKAPVPATPTAPVPARTPVTTSIAPQAAQAAEPTITATTPAVTNSNTNGDENGQIKGDETNNDTEKTNWTPWIVLFVLILLAGAATGGYFYWFAGDDEVKSVVREPKKDVKSEKFETSTKSKPNKKSKRW